MSDAKADSDLKLAIEEHRSRWTEVEQEASRPCFDKAEFERRISEGDDWQKLIQAHLYLEFIASRMLEAEMPRPKDIDLFRMSFSSKLSLISALGLFPVEFVPAVRKVAKLRNNVAHDLRYDLPEKDVNNLRNSVPKWLRTIAEEQKDRRETDPLSLQELLRVIPLIFEMYRQLRSVHNAKQHHREEGLRLAMENAKRVIEKASTEGNRDS